jgi:hypothetical protein
MVPAKFSFDVNAALTATNCTSDYVAFNTSLAASATSPSIVAFDNLYTTQPALGGLCAASGPSVKWAYQFGTTGSTLTSVVLSGDGTKVAFVESRINANGGSILHILKWKPGATVTVEGTLAAPAIPTTLAAGKAWSDTTACPVASSCVANIPFNGAQPDSTSSPFYVYTNNADVLYVGDNNGVVHKFTGVFNGTPAEAGSPWPIAVHSGFALTSPIYESGSGNIFVGDSSGRLSFIQEVGSTVGGATPCTTPLPATIACLNTVNLSAGTAGSIVDAPIVDGTNKTVFVVNGTDTANHGTILQASTGLTAPVSIKIGGNSAGSPLYSGAFDNTYINSASGATAGHMYVCGKDGGNANRPAIYQLSFSAAGVLQTPGNPLIGLTNGASACSPITEVFNTATDWIFFSVGSNLNPSGSSPLPAVCRGSGHGCVLSINLTTAPAIWSNATITNGSLTPANPAGSTSGFVVDNVSGSAQASSIYFTYGTNSTATITCNGTTGVGCAVKLTQSGLL